MNISTLLQNLDRLWYPLFIPIFCGDIRNFHSILWLFSFFVLFYFVWLFESLFIHSCFFPLYSIRFFQKKLLFHLLAIKRTILYIYYDEDDADADDDDEDGLQGQQNKHCCEHPNNNVPNTAKHQHHLAVSCHTHRLPDIMDT